MANKAVETAAAKFEEWKLVGAKKRADYLFKAARLMRKRKHEFSATMVYEVGKTWPEADADTAEAIDFLEFYAREMIRYTGPKPVTKISSEKSELRYIPLDAVVVVPPWNFACDSRGHDLGCRCYREHCHVKAVERFTPYRLAIFFVDARSWCACRRHKLCLGFRGDHSGYARGSSQNTIRFLHRLQGSGHSYQ